MAGETLEQALTEEKEGSASPAAARAAGDPAATGAAGGTDTPDPDRAADCPRFQTLKNKSWRGPATRYDRTPDSYEAGLHLRGSIMWLKLLTSTT
ncbi:hypothetical protein [Streptomyces prunicolor]